METEDCNIESFLAKIDCVSSRQAVHLANIEVTNVERFLLKEKSLSRARREKLVAYADQLKKLIAYERSYIGPPKILKQRNRLFSD